MDALDYLLKPVTADRFAVTVARAVSRLGRDATARTRVARAMATREGHRVRFVVRRGSSHSFVAARDVEWINAEDNYLQLHAGGRTHLVRGTMKDAERELDPATFLRIHRSTIVNVARIAAIDAQPTAGTWCACRTARSSTPAGSTPPVRALLSPFRR